MIRRLRRRLTLIFTLLTSLVLAVVLAATVVVAWAEQEASQKTLLVQSLDHALDLIQVGGVVSDAQLAELEQQLQGAVILEDNGLPLHFPGVWPLRTSRAVLLERVNAYLQEHAQEYSTSARLENFTVHGDQGERYLACAAQLRTEYAGGQDLVYSAVVLADRSNNRPELFRLIVQDTFIGLAGAVLLAVISWSLAGFAIRPTAESLRAQNEFVAAASHELRSPLAVIRASLAAARGVPQGCAPEAARFLDTADREAARLGRLVGDLLLLAGSDAKAWTADFSPVNLDTFCAQIYEQYHLYCSERGHVLRVHLPQDHLPTVTADRERLLQLLGVLFSNAAEYAPPGTPIEFLVFPVRRSVCFEVADHGPGVPDGDKERIFTRFARAEASRSDKAHFGLGLSVARELAALHQGSLVCADTPGGGATFRFTMPLEP